MTRPSSRDKLVGKKIAVIGADDINPALTCGMSADQLNSIGFGIAKILLEHGARIIVISSQQAHVDDAVSRLNAHIPDNSNLSSRVAQVTGLVGNLRDEAAVTSQLIALAPLDHVVFTSVDRIIRGPLASADLDDARHLFGLKFWGSVVVAKALAAHEIVRPGGSLTLTSGLAALRPSMGTSLGGALNGGLNTLTQGLAMELSAKKIRANTVVPGLCRTELWDKQGHSREAQEEVMAAVGKDLSVGFVALPEDVAEAYLYLIRADYANGTTVVIDGGAHI
ncbi:hypothetical protein VPNG_06438 [Cytospora leucostoma]|uniref:Ketoreductase (KR) domain-containing protein n=1 Tax=Cytospora leucostoma TaxID=1230097 RepID=A0A423WYU5_9PEZI|nr:hypothetical protein VPNG_06438 [Cytospora leucostoma]